MVGLDGDEAMRSEKLYAWRSIWPYHVPRICTRVHLLRSSTETKVTHTHTERERERERERG